MPPGFSAQGPDFRLGAGSPKPCHPASWPEELAVGFRGITVSFERPPAVGRSPREPGSAHGAWPRPREPGSAPRGLAPPTGWLRPPEAQGPWVGAGRFPEGQVSRRKVSLSMQTWSSAVAGPTGSPPGPATWGQLSSRPVHAGLRRSGGPLFTCTAASHRRQETIAGKTQMVNHHPGRLRTDPQQVRWTVARTGPRDDTLRKRTRLLTGGVGALMTRASPGAPQPLGLHPAASSDALGQAPRPAPGATALQPRGRSEVKGSTDLRPPVASHTRTRGAAQELLSVRPNTSPGNAEYGAQRHPGDVSATGGTRRIARSQGLELCPTSKAEKC